jgi:hypothetical protein
MNFSKEIDVMKLITVTLCASLIALAGAAGAQTSPAPQTRPDARYPNPSGQDSQPSQTRVNPTKTAPPSSNPEDASTATKGDAAKRAYSAGKKADDSAGCSTPTTAADAGTAPADSRTRASGEKVVCTTTGNDSTKSHQATAPAKKPEAKTPPADR